MKIFVNKSTFDMKAVFSLCKKHGLLENFWLRKLNFGPCKDI